MIVDFIKWMSAYGLLVVIYKGRMGECMQVRYANTHESKQRIKTKTEKKLTLSFIAIELNG